MNLQVVVARKLAVKVIALKNKLNQQLKELKVPMELKELKKLKLKWENFNYLNLKSSLILRIHHQVIKFLKGVMVKAIHGKSKMKSQGFT